MKKALEENLKSPADNNLPLLHHTVFIAASLRSWRDYLAYLDTELQRLVNELSTYFFALLPPIKIYLLTHYAPRTKFHLSPMSSRN